MSVENSKRKAEDIVDIDVSSNPIDEVVQLYVSHVIKDFKSNEPRYLNGVINYCNDYMISRDAENNKKQKVSGKDTPGNKDYKYFGALCAVYGLALSKLSYFLNKGDDEEYEGEIDHEKMFKDILEAYDNSFEFIEMGIKGIEDKTDFNYKLLQFVKSLITFQKVANYFIGKEMVSYYEFDEHIKAEVSSDQIAELFTKSWKNIQGSLVDILAIVRNSESEEESINEFIVAIVPDLLQTLNVIFDSNETIGTETKEKLLDEGIDETFEFQVVKELPKKHPLSKLHSEIIEHYPSYVSKLREMSISCNELLEEFAETLPESSEPEEETEEGIHLFTKETLLPLRLETLRTIGDYFLKELDNKDTKDKKMESLLKQNSIYMSKLYQLSESPDDWVIYSESLIQLSALNEDNQKISDKLLKKALKLLQKANRVSNGKYDDFIESLQEDLK